MIELTREVRFFKPEGAGPTRPSRVSNSWSAWPTADGRYAYWTVRCTLRGDLSAATDYLCNVKDVDHLLRQFITSREQGSPSGNGDTAVANVGEPVNWLRDAWQFSQQARPAGTHLARLELQLSPQLGFSIDEQKANMIKCSQQFEFSASHRLHNLRLSDQENRELYGKCNNPHGHGHNYVVVVTVSAEDVAAREISVSRIDELVKAQVIDRLDHRHLNIEVPPFDELNPTVENIAITIWNWMVAAIPAPLQLDQIRVYETPKTWADYRGPNRPN